VAYSIKLSGRREGQSCDAAIVSRAPLAKPSNSSSAKDPMFKRIPMSAKKIARFFSFQPADLFRRCPQ
ncbi:hypothetical protein ACT2TJ_005901, partial [Raoultella planticola]